MKEVEQLGSLAEGSATWDESGAFQIVRSTETIAGVWDCVDSDDTLDIERALAHLLLRTDPEHVAFVVASAVSPETEDRITRFVTQHAPAHAWAIADRHGNARLVVPNLNLDERCRSTAEHVAPRRVAFTGHTPTVTATRNQSVFTDLNEWLLKVMLLNRAPTRLWSRPRLELSGPADLSNTEWVQVSQGKAYQFAHTLREVGFLNWRRGTFELIDVPRLLKAWLDVARTLRPHRLPVRSPLGDSILEVFAENSTGVSFALAGAIAAEAYEMRHIQRSVEEVYVWGELEAAAQALMVEPCEPSLADFYLVRPLHRSSVERGVQEVDDVQVVDIIQSALDSVRRAARGTEQADYVMGEVAQWFK